MVGEIEKRIKEIFLECIDRHNYKVLELETNKDHVHMLVVAKDREELSAMVRTLKAVSAKEINGTPRFRVGNKAVYYRRKRVLQRSSFWARRYGWNELLEEDIQPIREYIQNQKVLL